MATWFGTLVGMMGLRNTGLRSSASSITLLRPSPPMYLGAASSTLLSFPNKCTAADSQGLWGSLERRTSHRWRRNFATIRGGGADSIADQGSAEPASPLAQQLSMVSYPTSAYSAQGFRSYMEDEYFISLDGDFAAVFDGHGGPAVSRYLRKNLYANVQAALPVTAPRGGNNHNMEDHKNDNDSSSSAQDSSEERTALPTSKDFEAALASALDKIDLEVQRISHWSYQGSTAVAIWIHENRQPATVGVDDTSAPEGDNSENRRTIIAANIGDSRAVLCRNNTAWELTRDHKPNDPAEQARIEKSGGKVVWCGDVDREGEPILERGVYRVNGNLALSRAIGDRSERPHVTAEPEIIAIPVTDEDEFIVLATDGLWDVFESGEAVDLVRSLIEQGLPRDRVANWIVEESIRRGTYDNVTVVIIWLDRAADCS